MTRPSAVTTLIDDLSIIRQWSNSSPAVASPEIDTINVIIGDGSTVLTTGVKVALRVDFNAIITGAFVHEFDGTTGSVVVGIGSAAYVAGFTPTFTSIVASAPPTISSARYSEDTTLTGWTTTINRGDVLRFSITTVSSFTRLLICLRIRRLEP